MTLDVWVKKKVSKTFTKLPHPGIGDSNPLMLANATLYDGCVEKACIDMGITCCSQTDKQAPFNTGLQLVKSRLLDMWKAREGAMQNKIPKYQAEPNPGDLPTGPAEPEFKLCSLVDGCLVLPRDVRTEFLTDPVRGPEWRKIVGEFDRCFAVAAPRDAADAGPAASDEPANQQQAGFSWESIFADEPRDKASWHQKYDGQVKGKCQWCPQLTAYLVEAPSDGEDETPKYMLFVEASEDYTIPKDDVFLAYGAGTWLLDGKADAYMEENEGCFKGVLCKFTSDVALVVLEAGLVGSLDLDMYVNILYVMFSTLFQSLFNSFASVVCCRPCGRKTELMVP